MGFGGKRMSEERGRNVSEEKETKGHFRPSNTQIV